LNWPRAQAVGRIGVKVTVKVFEEQRVCVCACVCVCVCVCEILLQTWIKILRRHFSSLTRHTGGLY
jgi:L-lactate utilization protein LutB